MKVKWASNFIEQVWMAVPKYLPKYTIDRCRQTRQIFYEVCQTQKF